MADWNELVNYFERDGLTVAREKEIIYPVIYTLIEEYDRINVIDFGCGIGRFCYAITDFCTKIMGIDMAPKMIEHANKNYTDKGIKFTTDSIYDMKIKKFDFFTALFSLQYLNNSDFDKLMNLIAESKINEVIIANDSFDYVKRCINNEVGPFKLEKGTYYNSVARRKFQFYPRTTEFLIKTFANLGFNLVTHEKIKYPIEFHERYGDLKEMPKGIAAFNVLQFVRE